MPQTSNSISMKFARTFVLLAVAASMPLGMWAQEDPKPKKEAPQGERGERPRRGEGRPQGQRADRLAQLSESLSLTEEQKGKLKPILEAQRAKAQELRDNTALTVEERREKSRAQREEFNGKIKEVLTKEQQEKFEQIRRQGPGQRQRGADGQPQRPRQRRQQQAE